MDLSTMTREVCRIAKETGIYLAEERKRFKKENVREKQAHDYVSYVDREAEERTVSALHTLCPEAGFVTEEGTVEQSAEGLSWVVDPLDGTTNFIQNHAPFCVSIALRRDEELLLGVVYEVCRAECFYAWKGGRAWLNDTPIRVSEHTLENAFIGLELPYDAEAYKPVVLHAINTLYGRVAGFRMNGSAAAALCEVAAGRYDGWAEAFIHPWDYSAGVLVVREAGGRVTDFTGKEHVAGHHVVATNGVIHEEFRKIMNAKRFL